MNEILDNKDIESATWTKIKTHYITKRNNLLIKLAGDISEEETLKIRGRIRECNDLLKLEDRCIDEPTQTE